MASETISKPLNKQVNDLSECYYLGNIGTLAELVTALNTYRGTLSGFEQRPVCFGVKNTHDSIFEFVPYTGTVFRMYNDFIGIFANTFSHLLIISTTNGDTQNPHVTKVGY